MWRLVGVQGVYSGRLFNLDKDSMTIGKGSGCGISLAEDHTVAEDQAEVLLCNGGYVFKDVDSACPTMLNGTVPAGMVTLNHGDMIQIGESIFRVEHAGSQTRACSAPGVTQNISSESTRQELPWRLRCEHIAVVALLIVLVSTLGVFAVRKLTHSVDPADKISHIQNVSADLAENVDEYEKQLQQCELLNSQIEEAKNSAVQHNDRQSEVDLTIACGALKNAISCQKKTEDRIPELSTLQKKILLHRQFSACYREGSYAGGYLNEREPMRFRHIIPR